MNGSQPSNTVILSGLWPQVEVTFLMTLTLLKKPGEGYKETWLPMEARERAPQDSTGGTFSVLPKEDVRWPTDFASGHGGTANSRLHCVSFLPAESSQTTWLLYFIVDECPGFRSYNHSKSLGKVRPAPSDGWQGRPLSLFLGPVSSLGQTPYCTSPGEYLLFVSPWAMISQPQYYWHLGSDASLSLRVFCAPLYVEQHPWPLPTRCQ